MSFLRHEEIFPNDPGATPADCARAHRPDESPVGYSSAGCSPASPTSASPTGSQCALNSSCWSTDFHRTANCVLTVCLNPGAGPVGITPTLPKVILRTRNPWSPKTRFRGIPMLRVNPAISIDQDDNDSKVGPQLLLSLALMVACSLLSTGCNTMPQSTAPASQRILVQTTLPNV
jgi:hypothetical protein